MSNTKNPVSGFLAAFSAVVFISPAAKGTRFWSNGAGETRIFEVLKAKSCVSGRKEQGSS